MKTRDIIVIGASAGGVEATRAIAAELPADLRAAVFIVLHLSRGRSVLPAILGRAGRLPAVHPGDGDPLKYGRVYVAPPDHHMTLEADVVRVLRGPTENGVRPAVDPLFRSAARAYGSRVVGVILTGSLDDGTAGLAAIQQAGGVTIVQDPREAFAPSMPQSAMEAVQVDHVLPLREIPLLLARLTLGNAGDADSPAAPHTRETDSDAAQPPIAVQPADRSGAVSVLSCPECHGVLWEDDEGGVLRFRCRVGHVYSPESMLAVQTESVDRALWAALRSLEERSALNRKLSERANRRQQHGLARAFDARAKAAARHAAVMRDLLLHHAGAPAEAADPEEEQETQKATLTRDREN